MNSLKEVELKKVQGDGSSIVVAATQITGAGLPASTVSGFIDRCQDLVRKAAEDGAQLILLPELFSGPYFCQSQEAVLMQLADEHDSYSTDPSKYHFLVRTLQPLARQYGVVLPVSFFERKNNTLYNSVAVIDADGSVLPEVYRKAHIPDGTGYQEKFYFSPGDTGFRIFHSNVFNLTFGIGICWDQWFPETARALALQGAELLLYPTAIGSEPQDSSIHSGDHWHRVMQGHSAANMVPVVASNRYGTEILLENDSDKEKQRITFYGTSFVTDNTGAIVAQCTDKHEPTYVLSTIPIKKNRDERTAWGLFRDRRPELYQVLLSKDGNLKNN